MSAAAVLPELRGWVDARLRKLTPPFLAEGRDMGSTVFPQAEYKFYLYASPRVRAERRVLERTQDLESVEAALGSDYSEANVKRATENAVDPGLLLGDRFASAEYRAHLAGVFTQRAIAQATA